jgi:hypothetical protein
MSVLAIVVAAAATIIVAGQAAADTIHSTAAFNTGIQQETEQQPADGVTVTYPVAYTSDELDGCTAQAVETLYPRDDASWGIYEVSVDVTCDDGGFAFTATGSWDEKGLFHGAGKVTEGSGTGSYAGLAGRLAQSGSGKPAQDNTEVIAYELRIDRAAQ